jgi:hypothetical protein
MANEVDTDEIDFRCIDLIYFQCAENENYDCIFCTLVGSIREIEAVKLLSLRSTMKDCKVYVTSKAKDSITNVVMVCERRI